MLTTTPNLLTVGRIACIPVLVAMLYLERDWARWTACTIFVVAATTDYVDGYLARNWQQQSLFGRWLDPVADKLLVASAVVMLVGFDRAPLLPALIIVLREITVSGLREYMAEVSVGLPVSRLAKWKTAVQMTAIGFLLVGDAGPAALPIEAIGWWGLWLAALLTLVTGWDYLQAGLAHMLREPARRPTVETAERACADRV
jgi:cardiolipin synthase